LPVHTTAEALFKVFSYFITTNKLQWGNCVSISTDGAQEILGYFMKMDWERCERKRPHFE
jgi:cytochrome c oxidase subunit IV